jgi:sugar phosphate isomerase/epimerase
MLNISLSTAFSYKHDFIEIIDIISQSNCSFIELFINNMIRDIPTSSLIKEIEKMNLTVRSIHTPLDFLLKSDEDENYWIYKCIELANALDAKTITTHIIKKENDGININLEDQHKNNLIMFANNDISICTENLPLKTNEAQSDSFLRRYRDLKEFITEYGLFLTYDVTHWASTNTSIIDGYEYFKDYIRNIHLSDYKSGIEHMVLGTGDLEVKELIHKLQTENYQYPLTIELDLVSEDRSPLEKKDLMIDALNTSLQLVLDSLSSN